MLLKEIKDIFHKELGGVYPKEEIDSFFYRCIEHYLKMERFILAVQPGCTLTKDEEQPLFKALAQLKTGKPLQYILGTAHFRDLELQVNENVLIPRPETEELVQWILDDVLVKKQTKKAAERSRSDISTLVNDHSLQILDIGTGSGCIAIALAKQLPDAKIYALDISKEALAIAEKNAMSNGVELTFIEADILHDESKIGNELVFDVIVSNPPYVRELEKKEIHINVKDFEPETALFVPDEDPLLFYRAILDFAEKYLSDEGKLYFEINQYLGRETKALLKAYNFLEIELRKDIFGNDRMLKAKRK